MYDARTDAGAAPRVRPQGFWKLSLRGVFSARWSLVRELRAIFNKRTYNTHIVQKVYTTKMQTKKSYSGARNTRKKKKKN